MKEDGADVCVTEAVRVEDLDESLVPPLPPTRPPGQMGSTERRGEEGRI